jgi:hypothetical protein
MEWQLHHGESQQTAVEEQPSLRFERRQADRWSQHGAASAFRLAGERFGQIHDLKMLDYSFEGMGAHCAEPIEPGTLVSIGFQAPGCIAKRGVVTRCLPSGDGYRIGIRFEMRMAA